MVGGWLKRGSAVIGGLLVSPLVLGGPSGTVARQLIEMPYFTNASISPDGRHIAFQLARPSVERNDVELQWYVERIDGHGGERPLASGGKAMWLQGYGTLVSPKVAWTSDSTAIVFQALEGDALVLMRANLNGQLAQLTDQPADVDDFELEGTRVWYETRAVREQIERAEQSEYDQGVRLTPSVKVEDKVYHNTYYRGRLATIRWDLGGGPDVPLLADAPRTIWEMDFGTGKSRIALPEERKHYEGLKRDEDTDPISDVMYRDHFNGRSAFATKVPDDKGPEDEISIASPKYQLAWSRDGASAAVIACHARPCVTGRYGIRGVKWRADAREVLFLREDPGLASTLYAWNVTTGFVRAIQSFAGTIGRGGDGVARVLSAMCPATERYAICVTAGPEQPPRLERVDLDSGLRQVLFDPNEKLRSELNAHVEQVAWKDKWGRRVTGVLVTPSAARVSGRLPLVLTGYTCGGFLEGGVGRDVPEYALAAEGIAALCVNMNLDDVRGMPYPSGDIPAGPRADLQSYLDAWESGVDFLHGRDLVDVTRVGISGLSFGAEAVHYATIHSNRFAAAAACQGDIKDPINYYVLYSRGAPGADALRYYGMPPPDKDPLHYYETMSPALNVDKIRIPVLIQTSESEFRYGLEYYAAMTSQRRPLDYYIFPQEEHNFFQPKHRLAWNARFLDWFAFWLNGLEDPDPSKRTQYVTWEALRQHEDLRQAPLPN